MKERKMIPVEGYTNLQRDSFSKAILNCDIDKINTRKNIKNLNSKYIDIEKKIENLESNINDIIKIKINCARGEGNTNFNEFVLFDFDKIKIHMKCLKISDSLLYFPFDNKKNYDDTSILNSQNGLFLSRSFSFPTDHLNIKITILFQKKTNIKLYYLTLNGLRYNNGLVYFSYSM